MEAGNRDNEGGGVHGDIKYAQDVRGCVAMRGRKSSDFERLAAKRLNEEKRKGSSRLRSEQQERCEMTWGMLR